MAGKSRENPHHGMMVSFVVPDGEGIGMAHLSVRRLGENGSAVRFSWQSADEPGKSESSKEEGGWRRHGVGGEPADWCRSR